MELCNPSTNVDDLRLVLRTQYSVPKRYASRLDRKQVCGAFQKCKGKSLPLPPFRYQKVNPTTGVYVPRDSPLTARDFYNLFSSPKLGELQRIAKKLGVFQKSSTKSMLFMSITEYLKALDLPEPIQVRLTPNKVENKNNSNNLNLNNRNLNNRNNLNNKNNLNNRNLNNKNNLNNRNLNNRNLNNRNNLNLNKPPVKRVGPPIGGPTPRRVNNSRSPPAMAPPQRRIPLPPEASPKLKDYEELMRKVRYGNESSIKSWANSRGYSVGNYKNKGELFNKVRVQQREKLNVQDLRTLAKSMGMQNASSYKTKNGLERAIYELKKKDPKVNSKPTRPTVPMRAPPQINKNRKVANEVRTNNKNRKVANEVRTNNKNRKVANEVRTNNKNRTAELKLMAAAANKIEKEKAELTAKLEAKKAEANAARRAKNAELTAKLEREKAELNARLERKKADANAARERPSGVNFKLPNIQVPKFERAPPEVREARRAKIAGIFKSTVQKIFDEVYPGVEAGNKREANKFVAAIKKKGKNASSVNAIYAEIYGNQAQLEAEGRNVNSIMSKRAEFKRKLLGAVATVAKEAGVPQTEVVQVIASAQEPGVAPAAVSANEISTELKRVYARVFRNNANNRFITKVKNSNGKKNTIMEIFNDEYGTAANIGRLESGNQKKVSIALGQRKSFANAAEKYLLNAQNAKINSNARAIATPYMNKRLIKERLNLVLGAKANNKPKRLEELRTSIEKYKTSNRNQVAKASKIEELIRPYDKNMVGFDSKYPNVYAEYFIENKIGKPLMNRSGEYKRTIDNLENIMSKPPHDYMGALRAVVKSQRSNFRNNENIAKFMNTNVGKKLIKTPYHKWLVGKALKRAPDLYRQLVGLLKTDRKFIDRFKQININNNGKVSFGEKNKNGKNIKRNRQNVLVRAKI